LGLPRTEGDPSLLKRSPDGWGLGRSPMRIRARSWAFLVGRQPARRAAGRRRLIAFVQTLFRRRTGERSERCRQSEHLSPTYPRTTTYDTSPRQGYALHTPTFRHQKHRCAGPTDPPSHTLPPPSLCPGEGGPPALQTTAQTAEDIYPPGGFTFRVLLISFTPPYTRQVKNVSVSDTLAAGLIVPTP
jgi:hypothetical protein